MAGRIYNVKKPIPQIHGLISLNSGPQNIIINAPRISGII